MNERTAGTEIHNAWKYAPKQPTLRRWVVGGMGGSSSPSSGGQVEAF